MPAKLHEVLAVEGGLQTTAKSIAAETIKTFGQKDAHFVGVSKSVSHFAEEDANLNTIENKALVTTVAKKLAYMAGSQVKALDAYLQKEATNQRAFADLEVDGKVIATEVPATVLLGLETKLADLRKVYEEIPTLAPGPVWEPDLDQSSTGDVYKARDATVTFRTKRMVKPIIMAPATKEHPAQVQAIQEDVPVAKISAQEWSGMMSSADKSELLGRLDKLLRAVKRARQRANSTEVVSRHIGKTIFEYLHAGVA